MRSLKVNFLFNSANQMLSIIIPLITTPYLSRVLGAEMLGVFSYANAIAYYFTLFGMLGLANYGAREIAKVRGDNNKVSRVFSGIYTAQLITCTVVVVVYFIYMLFSGSLMSKIYFIQVLSIAFDISWLCFGLEEFDVTLRSNFLVKLLSTICIFLFVRDSKDVYLYAFISVLSSLAGYVVLWKAMKGKTRFIRTSYMDVKKHMVSNLTLFLPILLVSIYKVMDKLMLKWLSSYSEVGFYECADKLGQVPLFLVSSLSQIMIPRISFLVASEKKDGASNYLYKSLLVISLLVTTVIFGIVGVSDIFVPIYFGEGYEECVGLIMVILPSYIFSSYASTIRAQLLIPYGRDKEFIISLAVGSVCNVSLNLLLIPKYDALGAAIATAVTECIVCIITIVFVKQFLNLKRILFDSVPFYISGIIMLVVLYFVNSKEKSIICLIAKIMVGAFAYLITVGLIYALKKHKKLNRVSF